MYACMHRSHHISTCIRTVLEVQWNETYGVHHIWMHRDVAFFACLGGIGNAFKKIWTEVLHLHLTKSRIPFGFRWMHPAEQQIDAQT